jgi:2-(1,2-epoxy-1,2-dihydrophenyl)acetyl-CoA isomerase
MAYQTLSLERRGAVAVITLDRPDAGNSLNMAMAEDLMHVGLECEGDPGVRCVVITGAGSVFCFGGDLKAMSEQDNLAGFLNALTAKLHAAISVFNRMRAPVVVAVNGAAAGAGVGLLAMADLAIAAKGAKITLAYTGVALTPDGSSTYFLPRMVGRRRALELMLTNRALNAEEACEWGLLNQVVPGESLMAEALALADRLAAGPTGAFGTTKRLLLSSEDNSLEAQMALEGRTIAAQGDSMEGKEGVSAFLAKRRPDYR